MAFSLHLADNQRWRFQAEAVFQEWLCQFASVLNLGKDDASSATTLTFRQKKPTDAPPLYDLGILTLRQDSETAEWFCDIDTAYNGDFFIDRMLYALYTVYRETVHRRGFPFHAGLIEQNGRGILIAGSSGKGKSTACRRLTDTCHVLCDEETLIVRNSEGGYWAHPFPTWSSLTDSPPLGSWPAEKALPITHILFLEPSEENTLTPMGKAQSVMHITKTALEKCRWSLLNPEDGCATRRQVFDNACLLAQTVPASSCRTTLSGPLERMITSLEASG